MHGTMAYSLQFKDSKRQTAETVCLIHPILGGFTNCPCEHRPKFAGDFVFEGYLKCSHLYTNANTYIFGYTKNFFNS